MLIENQDTSKGSDQTARIGGIEKIVPRPTGWLLFDLFDLIL